MMSSTWTLLLLCCALGALTAAVPLDQSNLDLQDEDSVLGDVLQGKTAASSLDGSEEEAGDLGEGLPGDLAWDGGLESLSPRALALDRHVQQYERAAVNMADQDLFPTHLCEAASLNRMRRTLLSLPNDSVLRALLMVTLMQSEGCREGALHTATKLRDLIQAATSQQPHDVIAETGDVTSKDAASAEEDSEEEKGGQGAREAWSHCQALGECRWRGIQDVRAIMAEEPDLLLLYDVMATAVFGTSGRSKLAQALGRDVLDDLQGKRPGQAQHLLPRFKRFGERDFHSLVGWSPFSPVSAVYNFGSAAWYAWGGDYGMAKSRVASGVLDLAVPKVLQPVTRRIRNRWLRWGAETAARKEVEEATGYK